MSEVDLNLEQGDVIQLVSFKLGSEEFAVDILRVQEIIRLMEITRVPRSPEFIKGVINIRGRVIPVMDLRTRFQMDNCEDTNSTRIMVIELEGNTVGFKVDEVTSVLRLPSDTVEPPPSMVAGVDAEYISGVGKLDDRLLILLDVEHLLSKSEKDALRGIGTDKVA